MHHDAAQNLFAPQYGAFNAPFTQSTHNPKKVLKSNNCSVYTEFVPDAKNRKEHQNITA